MAKLNLDGHKLSYHPKIVADFLDGEDIMPLYVEISPSAHCNHHCIFCHYNYLGHQGLFPQGRMKSLVEELADVGVKSIVFAGTGEPLLHPETIPVVTHAKKLGMDVAMSTNGGLLKENDLEILAHSLTWIRFSFNGGNADNYAQIHQAKKEDYLVVLENIKKLKQQKDALQSKITIGIQYILLEPNKDYVVECAQTMKGIGVDYFVVKYFYDHGENQSGLSNAWLTDEFISTLQTKVKTMTTEKFSFVVRDKKHLSKDRIYDTCYGLPFIVYIREDGEAYTCFSYQHDKNTSLGNITKQSFPQIWAEKQKAIDYINSTFNKNNCQPNCRHHQINNFLWELKHPTVEHVNFI
ncbi:radical SAM protein [Candidatus Omnitrophota bacterium]